MESIDDQKLREILVAAKELFWKYGFKRVTIEEVCREAKVSKMTFYKHFKNKIDLVKKIYELEVKKGMQKYRSIMDSEIPFVEKVEKSMELKREQTENLSQEFYDDILKSDIDELKEMFNKAIQNNIQIILNDYIQAQKKREIRKDIKPEFILYFMNHMMEMAKDQRLSGIYSNPNEMIMELNNFFFYGVLPRK